jgi:pSer/pThr/pTyr-binding forkhead associated (FHA) protein
LALRAFPCVIGRHRECDHRLACRFVSRRHCGFSVRGGRVWVEDLGSRNGTRLNGQPVEGPRPLHDGDRLDLACLPFEVRLSSPSGQARL